MSELQTFKEFFTTSAIEIPVFGFAFRLIITALLSFVLSKVYSIYGDSLSNRKIFGRTLVLLSLTTMFIITVIKSSLALSLGLVGALSIVRFRAAIKEPEELSYLFLSIALGLGFGANQEIITIIAFAIILGIIIGRKLLFKKERITEHLNLVVSSKSSDKVTINTVVEILKEHCSVINLKRFDESPGIFEAAFLVDFEDFHKLNDINNALQSLDNSISLKYIDNKGIY